MTDPDLPASFDLWPEADQFAYLENATSKTDCKRLLFAYLGISEDPDDLSYDEEWPTIALAARQQFLMLHPDQRFTEDDLVSDGEGDDD